MLAICLSMWNCETEWKVTIGPDRQKNNDKSNRMHYNELENSKSSCDELRWATGTASKI